RRALVGGVVVHVHAGEATAAIAYDGEQPLETRLLGFAVERPDTLVARHAVVVEVDPPKQILERAAGLVPRVAFKVEPVVDRVRVRHPAILDRSEEPLAKSTIVREEIVRAKRLAVAKAINDVHRFRPPPLYARELLCVETEL